MYFAFVSDIFCRRNLFLRVLLACLPYYELFKNLFPHSASLPTCEAFARVIFQEVRQGTCAASLLLVFIFAMIRLASATSLALG